MRLIRRTEWGARAPRHRTAAKWSQPATLHWNGPTITVGGKATWPHDRCAQLVRGIQNFHMDGRGWSDGAYNFVACPHRFVFELRGDSAVNGANGTTTGNRSSPTIMVLAGPGNPFTADEQAGILDARDHLVATTSTHPGLLGHRDHKPTDCPGDQRYRWLRTAPTAAPTSEEDDPMTPEDRAWIAQQLHEHREWMRAELGTGDQASDRSLYGRVRRHNTTMRDGLAKLIRRLPGAPQD